MRSKSIAKGYIVSNIIWIIVIGFIAGLIARVLSPGPNDPKGFLLTTVLGIAGARRAAAPGAACVAMLFLTELERQQWLLM